MFGYVVATLLFGSCLGQVPQRHNDKGHGALFSFNDFNNFRAGALHEGISGGIVQPTSFARPKELERSSFEAPKNVDGLRDFKFGDGHRGLLARDSKELGRAEVSDLLLAARPKSSGEEKFKDQKTKIGQAFAHVSQSFGSPSDFKEIPVHGRASGGVIAHNFGQDGQSTSHTTELGKTAVHEIPKGGGISHNRFPTSEGLESFGNDGLFQLAGSNNFRGAFNVDKGLEHRPPIQLGFTPDHGNEGSKEFSGVHKQDLRQSDGVSAHRQFFSPGNFERFSEGGGGGIHIGTNNIGPEIPHNGQLHFGSTPTNNGFPFNDHRFAKAPLRGGSSLDIPIRFDGAPGQEIGFSGHRQLGGLPNHRESLFHRNIGFGGGPTHGGSHINGQNRFNVQQGSGKNLIHNGSPFGGNLGLKKSPSRGADVIGEHERLSKIPLIGGSSFDDSLVHDGKFPGHKFDVHGIQENKFASTAFPFNGQQIFDETHANRGLIGHHGHLPKDTANRFIGNNPVPEKLSGDLLHFGNNDLNGNGFRSNSFYGNGFSGHGFGGIPFGGNNFDGNKLGGNGFRSDGPVGNIVHGSPISFENANPVNLRNLNIGVGAPKDGTVFDGLKEFGGRPRPIHDQRLFLNQFGPQLQQPFSLSNVDKQYEGFNEFGFGFSHENPSLNGPNRFPKGQVGIGSLLKEESVHSISPLNEAKQSGSSSFQRGPFFGGPFVNKVSEFNKKPEHLSSSSSIGGNKAINGPIKHGNSHLNEFSNTKPKGLGTDIIHIGSFDSVGLGKRGPSSDEFKVGSGKFADGFANSRAFFRTQKDFKDEAAHLSRPKNTDKGVTHKRSHGFEQSPINSRAPFDQTKTIIHTPINRGNKDLSHEPITTISLQEDPKTFIKPSPKRLTQIKQEPGNVGKTVSKKPPGAEIANLQHNEPVKSGPFYISHREYANEGPKGITSEKVNIPTRPLNDVSPRGKLSIRNPKESSRGRIAING